MSPIERPDPTTEAAGVMHLDTDPSAGVVLGVCTTSEAARLLDVSPTTVQVMVERGDLQAWKTRGGHRRIARASIDALREARAAGGAARGVRAGMVTVLIVEDRDPMRRRIAAAIAGWAEPVRALWAGDAFDALVLIERYRPDVLVSGLRAAPMDGFEFLRRLRAVPEYRTMAIVVSSALGDEDLEARGGLPAGTVRYAEPLPLDTLRGFVEACALRMRVPSA